MQHPGLNRHAATAALAGLLLWSGPSHAADMSAEDVDWTCGKMFAVTRDLGRRAVAGGTIRGASATARAPMFFAAQLPELGTLLFVKRSRGWTGYAIEDGGAIQLVRRSAQNDIVVIFSMLSREGPGHSYTILSTRNGFADIACSTLDFPKDLNEPDYQNEYLELVDFNIDASGAGTLIGSATAERDGKTVTRIYRYRTADTGRSWSQPEMLERQPDLPLAGVLRKLNGIPAAVIGDFKRSFRRR